MTSSDWSVSVNTWVAAPGDDTKRLEEALVRCQGEYLKYRVFSRKVRMNGVSGTIDKFYHLLSE